jgi:PmbA protein
VANSNELTLAQIAESALALAKKNGAAGAFATATEARSTSINWRDDRAETVSESTERALQLALYVDGRYSTVVTRDLRPDALETFIADSTALARALAPDPFRALPEPSLFADRSRAELALIDASVEKVTWAERKSAAQALVEAARNGPERAAIQSIEASWSDESVEQVMRSTNGFEGEQRSTQFGVGAGVSVNDQSGRKQNGGAHASCRFRDDLPALAELGRDAARRAHARLGQRRAPSAQLGMVVENRVAANLVRMLIGAMTGQALQQKRSYLAGQLGKSIGSPRLDLRDEPFLPRGLGSRHFDSEGLTARPRQLVEKGVARSFLIDTYYGRKLSLAPNSGSLSNLVLAPGEKSLPQLLSAMGEGILVTGFLGGNNNGLTGDYSLGVVGFRVRKGAVAEPISEMNIGGNQRELWNQLVAVGSDPWTYSSMRVPSLAFEKIQFAGA